MMVKKVMVYLMIMTLFVSTILSPANSIFASVVENENSIQGMSFSKKLTENIVVDGGLLEAEWNLSSTATHLTEGSETNNTLTFDTKWNEEYLYVAVNVTDSMVVNNNQLESTLWMDDTIEIFIDGNASQGVSYDEYDAQIFVRALDSKVYISRNNTVISLNKSIITATELTELGYTMEIAVPWSALNISPKSGSIIGFDITNDDCDVIDLNATRTSAITWNNTAGNNYASTANFGKLLLIKQTTPVVSTEGTPTIDGNTIEWSLNDTMTLSDNLITFGSLCDKNYLYVAVNVNDALIMSDSQQGYLDDGIEIYIDGNNAKSSTYDSDDRQFSLGPNHGITSGNGQSMVGVISNLVLTETGYSLELAVPWANLGVSPQAGKTIGFDIVNTDDDLGGEENVSWAAWSGTSSNWQSTEAFGNIYIQNDNITREIYSGPRGSLVDTTDDFSKVESFSEGIFVADGLGEKTFNTWSENQSLVYKSESDDIVEFEILTMEMGMPIELYTSPDGVTYTKLKSTIDYQVETLISASADTGWYDYLKYHSVEVPAGMNYLKLVFLTDGTNGYKTHIGNIRVDYKLAYDGRRMSFIDDADDTSKLFAFTDIYTTTGNGYNTSKHATWTENGTLIYQSPSGSILNFMMETVEGPGFAAIPAFEVYGSSDGVNYEAIGLEEQVLNNSEWFELKKYSVSELTWGFKYIKILFKTDAANSWAAAVSKVMFDCVQLNSAPSITYPHAMTEVNTPILINVGANDVEEDIIRYAIITQANEGNVSVDSNGNFLYTPKDDFIGFDSFIVEVADDFGGKAEYTIEVNVNYAPSNQTYYVNALDGDDQKDGLSEETAFASIQAAHDVSRPGDTILIMNGTYGQTSGEGVVNITRSGLPNAYITYKAYPGHKPILSVNDAWNHIRVTGADYIKIEGLTIIGNQDLITESQAQDVYNYMVDKMTNNQADSIDWAYVGTTNANGIFIASDNNGRIAHHIEIRNMDVSKCPGGGIGSSYGDYITIENNRVYDNCKWGIYGGSGISLYNMTNFDQTEDKYKNRIVNNRSYDNVHLIKWFSSQSMSDGNGIIIDDNKNEQRSGVSPYVGWTLVENNLAYGNGGSGIHAYSSNNVDIINNTSYMNNVTPELKWGEIFASSSDNVNIVNNILYGRGNKLNEDYGNNNVVYDYNIYYNGIPTISGDNDIVADPKFINPLQNNFRLQSDSPAVDSGLVTVAPEKDITGVLRVVSDRGAYELDDVVPVIELDQNDSTVSDEQFILTGNVSEFALLTINDVPVVLQELNFKHEIKLNNGMNVIRVIAMDESGNQSTTTLYINKYLTLLPNLNHKNVATVGISSELLQAYFENTRVDEGGIKTIKIVIEELIGAKAYMIELPAMFYQLNSGKNRIQLITPNGELLITDTMFKGNTKNIQSAKKVQISIGSCVDKKTDILTRSLYGMEHLLQLSLSIDSKQFLWRNDSSPVLLTVPYKPTYLQTKYPKLIIVGYLNGKGMIRITGTGIYDKVASKAIFKVTNF